MALTRSAASCSTAFRTSRPSRTSVVCHASLHNAQQPVVSRRAATLAASAWAVALFAGSQPARALIPDEEDEALLERAKANRQKKLQQQKETTREILKDEGLKNGKLDQDLVPVQKAVVQLAKSGARITHWQLVVTAWRQQADGHQVMLQMHCTSHQIMWSSPHMPGVAGAWHPSHCALNPTYVKMHSTAHRQS